MIPSVVARQVRETLLDYLRTTFAFADPAFDDALFAFLDGPDGLFRGPFVEVRLPFRKAPEGVPLPLEIAPPFRPYRHQLRAFERLFSADGHQPQHTLVTTGTGSGKTECFLFPVLDHCWRRQGERGVKAILLYPMNALATDQARRLARVLWDDPRLKGRVSAGLYVGGKGTHGVADRDHLVDQREVLRRSPPDVLLTNYKMLDFLLMRPEDAPLWEANRHDTLRYLVLDELHSYDGAQGSDVACLVRRLKARLRTSPGALCCIGTSATLGGGDDARDASARALIAFASAVFGETFVSESVVTEDRCSADEALGTVVDLHGHPGPADAAALRPEAAASVAQWLARQAACWLGSAALAADPIALGEALSRHDALRQLLAALGGRVRSLAEVDATLGRRLPWWEDLAPEDRPRALDSLLGLVSAAKRRGEAPEPATGDAADAAAPESVPPTEGRETKRQPELEPLLVVQCQLWARELRRLLRAVQDPATPPRFTWSSDGPRGGTSAGSDASVDGSTGTPGVAPAGTGEDDGRWLPIAHCRECGAAGWAALQLEGRRDLVDEVTQVGRTWFESWPAARYVAPGHGRADGEAVHLCPRCLTLGSAKTCRCRVARGAEPVRAVPVTVLDDLSDAKPPRFRATCPDCGATGGLSILGSRAPSLLSVAIGHLFQSDWNDDKKLLAFTDSVQDASHRAGFFGARTYRFNLRTALQAALDDAGAPVPLPELPRRVLDHWRTREPWPRLVATLLPPDLRELPAYERFLESDGEGQHPELARALDTRLAWEVVQEYGHAARIGRTLESTACSTAAPDDDAVRRAAEVLALDLTEQSLLQAAVRPAAGAIEHFLRAALHRLRVHGGVHHPLLEDFVASGGAWFELTKRRKPLLSPFGPKSIRPRFLTDRPGSGRTRDVFECFVSSARQPNWSRDWASRALGLPITDDGVNGLWSLALRRLEDAGVVRAVATTGGGRAWGIEPARLAATSRVDAVGCDTCGRATVLPADDVPRWSGRPCPRWRCAGTLGPAPAATRGSYYGRLYRSGRLQRVFAAEHTGLLTRARRETIEERFKSGAAPDAENLFVCTPTLEMGIDIGDLSGVLLCSVPPTTSSFLQRIGRAGRATGNAFALTLVNERPHDLYFQAEPLEMMAGAVLPPGCFLDAPEMLRRQLVAHAMDAWAAADPGAPAIPGKLSLVRGRGAAKFPQPFLDFHRREREALTDDFLARFRRHLSPDNARLLETFGKGDAVVQSVEGAFAEVGEELDELRAVQRRSRDRIKEIEGTPESVDDAEAELRELRHGVRLLERLIAELSGKYPLNVLTDAGVLPNYAFPEEGVTLRTVVAEPGDEERPGRRWQAYEYLRPASSGLRELAPFNTFYAEGRKLRINELDLGTRQRPLTESWRLCPDCPHARRELEATALEPSCPRCGARGWRDAGQLRTLVRFRRSRSLVTSLEAVIADDGEDRQEEYYELLDLVDVEPRSRQGARVLPELPFGWELLTDVPLREVNFGLSNRSRGGLVVAGKPVSDTGFVACGDCGRVRKGEAVDHAPHCLARKPGGPERLVSSFLYREVRSEAIRVLLPVADFAVPQTRASFQAALQLGLRRRFGGDPQHLQVKSMDEPVRGGRGRRHFLVLFDAVPGGTGYLADLWRDDALLQLLERARQALASCSCRRERARDGCYRCLYAYQSQRDLALISSRLAERLLGEILDRRATVESVPTLSDVSLDSRLESELEQRFLSTLAARVLAEPDGAWEERTSGGEERWQLRLGDRAWELRPQADLGPGDGVPVRCRPDFLARPVGGGAAPEVAIFCDGLAFHACPGQERGRIGDDVVKRTGVTASGRHLAWSITWDDVVEAEAGAASPTSASIFTGLDVQRAGKLWQALGAELPQAVPARGPVEMLLAFLRRPESAAWRTAAEAAALGWLATGPFVAAGDAADLEGLCLADVGPFEPAVPATAQPPDGDVVARWLQAGPLAVLARVPRASLARPAADGLRVVLRLLDDAASRGEDGFERRWRTFLQAWNLLQLLPGLEVASSEHLVELGARPVADRAAEAPSGAGTEAPAPEHAELLALCTAAGRPLVEAALAAGHPPPEVGWELPLAGGRVAPEADLAWPDAKLAVLAEAQAEDREAFEREGFRVLVQPTDAASVLGALRLAGEI